MFSLCIKWWSSLAFLTRSRLLRISLSGIKMMSLIGCPAWLKWKETGVGSLSWQWFKMNRRCSPNRSLSWRLVSPMYWHPAFTCLALHHRFWATYRKVLDKNRLNLMACRLRIRHSSRDSFQPVSLSRYIDLKSSGTQVD